MHALLKRLTRRRFLCATTTAAGSVWVVPGSVLGLNGAQPPSRRLDLACIGVGGRGGANLSACASENIVALCDVDQARAEAAWAKFPKAKRYQDFRRLFDELASQIDAVIVSTPDHTHAVAVMRAIKEGKHVYCEKPLAHSIAEVRAIQAAARQHRVVTQLGNQGHSANSIRRFHQMIHSGAIGPVREVHAWCGSRYTKVHELERAKQEMPVPGGLDWDLWLGPAPYRPYNACYLPGRWRGWLAFGTGVIGDWVCHVVDPVFWALDLGAPTTIQAQVTDYDPNLHGETCPPGTIVTYQFPAKGPRPAVRLIWYDGVSRPSRLPELDNEKLPDIGALVIGDKGKILYGSHGAAQCRIIPDEKLEEYRQTEQPSSLPKSPGHHAEWLRACKGGPPASAGFDYGGPLTELALLGIIAFRLPGTALQWDAAQMRFTHSVEANRYLSRPYRPGWSL